MKDKTKRTIVVLGIMIIVGFFSFGLGLSAEQYDNQTQVENLTSQLNYLRVENSRLSSESSNLTQKYNSLVDALKAEANKPQPSLKAICNTTNNPFIDSSTTICF